MNTTSDVTGTGTGTMGTRAGWARLALAAALWAATGAAAHAEGAKCDSPRTIDASLDGAGITGWVVRAVEGPVDVTAASGSTARLAAETCAADGVTVKLTRKGTIGYATVKVDPGTQVTVRLALPASAPALTFDRQLGAVAVHDLPTRVAVMSSTGAVDLEGVTSARIGYTAGDVKVGRVAEDVVLDAHTGNLSATGVGGNVIADGITGNLAVDDVGGRLEVNRATGTVVQNNVRGAIAIEPNAR